MTRLFAPLLALLATTGCQTTKIKPPSTFTVTDNTIQIIGQIDPVSSKAIINSLKKAQRGSTVYILLDSRSGGWASAAIEIMKAMDDKTTVCFARDAGPLAFTIFQRCTVRLVDGKTHLSTVRLRGELNGTAEEHYEAYQLLKGMEENITEAEAARLGVDLDEYKKKLTTQMNLSTTPEILDNKAADAEAKLECAPDGKPIMLRYTFFQRTIPVVISRCPNNRRLIGPEWISTDILQQLDIPVQINETEKET